MVEEAKASASKEEEEEGGRAGSYDRVWRDEQLKLLEEADLTQTDTHADVSSKAADEGQNPQTTTTHVAPAAMPSSSRIAAIAATSITAEAPVATHIAAVAAPAPASSSSSGFVDFAKKKAGAAAAASEKDIFRLFKDGLAKAIAATREREQLIEERAQQAAEANVAAVRLAFLQGGSTSSARSNNSNGSKKNMTRLGSGSVASADDSINSIEAMTRAFDKALAEKEREEDNRLVIYKFESIIAQVCGLKCSCLYTRSLATASIITH